ncbi:hypothetical protein GCM10027515_01140 [Schumannella luteola]|uniref:Uncharacterized protein n=1 Tax=Schumannella luteola TaxID=472059 RepID=A0A852Y707_9MICO|nr:hypothetical protein [Schumannella luteola]NYG98746.1 hypothetical protein [Schumannella luteola]TPX04330.1 hypothetical protein FJ656_12780 [Schumannella luteola]
MTDPHPYRDGPRPDGGRPRRRWVLPLSIAGGVAVVAVGAVIAALLLAPAPKSEAGASPKPSASASASPSASPKPAEKPSPRVRIDCESVLDRAAVDAYYPAGAELRRDTPTWIELVPFQQVGGLACNWDAYEARLRVTALPIDAVPDVLEYFHEDVSDPASPIATPASPRYDCGDGFGCSATAATATAAIVVSDLEAGPGREDAFRIVAAQAIAAVAAATVSDAVWVPPSALTMRGAPDCAAIDPDRALPAAIGESTITWGQWGGDGAGHLETRALLGGPRVDCVGDSGLRVSSVAGGRWAFDELMAAILGRSGRALDVAGVERVVFEDGSTAGYPTLTFVCADSLMQFRGDAALGETELTGAAEVWAAHYCAP